MCGIQVMVDGAAGEAELREALGSALACLEHRGPDDSGIELITAGKHRVGLGHRRLSIIDLSAAGRQPMSDSRGELFIVYNGEIYNYIELRAELQRLGHAFRTGTDTETILAAYRAWGTDAFARFNGMWALALLDLRTNELVLSRDRAGIKPLYFCMPSNRALLVSSETRPIARQLRARGIALSPNEEIICDYLRQNLINHRDVSWFEEIRSFPAGTWARIDLNAPRLAPPAPQSYWDPFAVPHPQCKSDDDAAAYLGELLADAVKIRLRSDVPVGCLLSGGLDSSSIASFARANGNARLLSAVSDNRRYDESQFIDAYAEHAGMQPHRFVCPSEPPADLFDSLRRLLRVNEQPFNSLSVLSYHALMKDARAQGVTVILSGQGADELLCGYKKYYLFYLAGLLRARRLPAFAREAWGCLRISSPQFKLAEAKRYAPFVHDPVRAALGEKFAAHPPLDLGASASLSERQLLDIARFTVPALVHYEDRMSMAHSREVRLPFLDYRLISFCLQSPDSRKLQKGWTKYMLRRAMQGRLPDSIVWRRDKQGFLTPQENWLGKPLKRDMEALLAEPLETERRGYVRPGAFRNLYERFAKGDRLVWHGDVLRFLLTELWLQDLKRDI